MVTTHRHVASTEHEQPRVHTSATASQPIRVQNTVVFSSKVGLEVSANHE